MVEFLLVIGAVVGIVGFLIHKSRKDSNSNKGGGGGSTRDDRPHKR